MLVDIAIALWGFFIFVIWSNAKPDVRMGDLFFFAASFLAMMYGGASILQRVIFG